MKKVAFVAAIFLAAAGVQIQAQSIAHTTWKGYFAELSDTVTFNFAQDENLATSSNGDTLVRSHLKFSGDTVTISDIDGKYPCVGQDGVYLFSVKGDTLVFTLVADACEGRSNISGVVWKRFYPDPSKK
jgi:hypothetical protein